MTLKTSEGGIQMVWSNPYLKGPRLWGQKHETDNHTRSNMYKHQDESFIPSKIDVGLQIPDLHTLKLPN